MSRNGGDVVIVSAVRTPIAKFGGGFKDLGAFRLAGVESMSNAPYDLKTARRGRQLNHGEPTAALVRLPSMG